MKIVKKPAFAGLAARQFGGMCRLWQFDDKSASFETGRGSDQ
jgi:hypothetical protein